MADTLHLQDLVVECRLGVEDWEREAPQTVWIDLEVEIDAARAAVRDDLQVTVDYAALAGSIQKLAQSRPYRLLETLAEEVASLVLGETGTAGVRVRVKKRSLAGIGYAAVAVERTAVRARPLRRRRAVRARRRLVKGALRR